MQQTSTDWVAATARRIVDELARAVVGKDDVLELAVAALLADGHVLIEDNPGLAKTLLARSLATVTGLEFARIQFTPDLMPADITGSSVLDQTRTRFEFRPGPVFANLVLGDEVNRAPPKTQAALLEAMEERQVTVDGTTRPLPRPFFVVATQNPIEYEGTYPLPEAQLDRFLVRLRIGYPTPDEEWDVLERRLARRTDAIELASVVDPSEVIGLQQAVERVHVSESVGRYIVALTNATRAARDVLVGASPRGSLALLKTARAAAAVRGRDFVTPEDVKAVAVAVLAHRLVLRPELWSRQVHGDEVVRAVLDDVATPRTEPDGER